MQECTAMRERREREGGREREGSEERERVRRCTGVTGVGRAVEL